ncbi:phage head closure protein [Clostridium intestinale]|uniref:phage head closure protein n=1 Tax=Clostridium intestinale TaxID=36845 RepID=UPI0028E4B981|nr:phage head closure protein [Clostridium intestinale]
MKTNINERISIKKRVVVIDKGKKNESWVDYYSCWCEVLDLLGKEKYEAYNSKLENSLKFKCRTCNKLKDMLFETKEYKAIWRDKEFNIVFIDTMGNSKKDIVLQVMAVG